MRKIIPLLACLGAALPILPGFATPDEEPAEPLSPSLPAVKVRLASLGSPSQVTLRPTGAASATSPAGEAVEISDNGMVVASAGGKLQVGDQRFTSLRVRGDAVSLQVGRLTRTYPGTLILTAGASGISVSNECELERYTEGVLAGECPALFHPEAIKAMAVAARTYSYRKAFLGKNDLCDTTHCQVYLGTGGVRPTIREGVRQTAGLCALYQGEVIDAVYSSDCGGMTEGPEDAWKGGKAIPYLRPVLDAPEEGAEPYCAVNRSHKWAVNLTWTRLKSLVGKAINDLTLDLLDFTASGRVKRLFLGPESAGDEDVSSMMAMLAPTKKPAAGRVITGAQWRQMLGTSVVRSLKFEVKATPQGVTLNGRGYGHGVGLCQFGANGMGKSGAEFRQILGHYYTDVEVTPAPTVAAAREVLVRSRMSSNGR